FLPQDSLLTILLTTAVSPGVSLPLKDLGAFSAGFQFQLKLTAVSLCGMVLGTLMALKRIR
ncbi:MAG TPA: hypothetical protein PK644_09925, partial [bacterium]|nr:hypothetical protein [bacterium]